MAALSLTLYFEIGILMILECQYHIQVTRFIANGLVLEAM